MTVRERAGPKRRRFGPTHRRGNVAFGVPLVLWSLLFSGADPGLFAQSADRLAAQYTEIARSLASGDFESGCAAAERLRGANERFFGVYNLLGMCAAHDGKLPEAEKLFRESLRLKPAFTPARHNLALNLAQQGRIDEAAGELDAILKAEPKDTTALSTLGKLELVRGRPAQALPFLKRAHQSLPEDTEVGLGLAAALSATGDRQGAAELTTALIDGNKDPVVLISAGILAVQNGNEQSGRTAFEKALTHHGEQAAGYLLQSARRSLAQDKVQLALVLLDSLEPRMQASAEWNALRGEAAFAQNQPEKAFEHLRKAVDLDPRSADYYIKLGELMIANHSDRAAAAVFETGLKNLPESHLLHFGLAICYLAGSRNWDEAHQHLREAVKLQPGFEPALELLCHTGVEAKEWARLRTDAETLVRLNPRSAKGHYFRALALQGAESQTRDPELLVQAQGAFDTALQLDPGYVDAWVEKGKLLAGQAKLQPAITALEKAVAIDPECEEAYFQLARLYKRAGNDARSREASAVHARLNRAKREQTERWRGLFQVQESGVSGTQGGERP